MLETTEAAKFKIFAAASSQKYKQRLTHFDRIVKDESWDVSVADAKQEKIASSKDFVAMSSIANHYFFSMQSRFPWRYQAQFIRMVLFRGLLEEIQSYRYSLVFGIGDREIDTPFEQLEASNKVRIHLAQLAENDERFSSLLTSFLDENKLDKFKAMLAQQRQQLDGEIELLSEISLKPRMLTLAECNAINRTSQLSCTKKWSIRMPGPEESNGLSNDVAFITMVPSLDGKIWRFSVTNPELIEQCEHMEVESQCEMFS
jgi:hypothetical protein